MGAAIQAMDDNAFGDQSNKCGTSALSLTGINHDKFNSCLTGAVGISSACSECYAVTADYGFKNCKAACLLGWCKQGCLDCTAPAQVDLPACTGIPAGSPKPCMETTAVSCSADDQAAIQAMDDNAFGDQSNTCGTNALSLTGINHDKFNSCLTGAIGISAACSECYAVTADYGFKNCKAAACLDGASRVVWIAQHRPRSIFQHALVFLPDLQHLAWRPLLSLALQMIRPQFRPWMTMPLVISPTNAVPVH